MKNIVNENTNRGSKKQAHTGEKKNRKGKKHLSNHCSFTSPKEEKGVGIKMNSANKETASGLSTFDGASHYISCHIKRKKSLFLNASELQKEAWYKSLKDEPLIFEPTDEDVVNTWRHYSASIKDEELENFKKWEVLHRKSDASLFQKMTSTGTLHDRISVLSLRVIDEHPVHGFPALESLLAYAKKKSRRDALEALKSLENIISESEIIPDKYTLRKFSSHDFSFLDSVAIYGADGVINAAGRSVLDRRLILWWLEDKLLQCYEALVVILRELLSDQLPATRAATLRLTFCFAKKPLFQKRFTAMLVNKVGDPEKKVGSKAAFYLNQLSTKSSDLKGIIVNEVESLLFRNNVLPHTQYYAVCALNQLTFCRNQTEDAALSCRLMNIYFAFFKAVVKQGAVETKFMSALITGVQRAFPYAQEAQRDIVQGQLESLYKLVHYAQFNVVIQTYALLMRATDISSSEGDRLCSSFYGSLLAPGLPSSSKHALLISIMFRMLKQDYSAERTMAFVRRLLQVCLCSSNVPLICGTLLMFSELFALRPSLQSYVATPRAFSDVSKEEENVSAKVYISDDDEEEVFFDALNAGGEKVDTSKSRTLQASSWVHKKSSAGQTPKPKYEGYDVTARNPLYAGAINASECVWELASLKRHFHPTVALFADSFIQGKRIKYPGDPLQDFSLIRFLDRFAFRNPKKRSDVSAGKKQDVTIGRSEKDYLSMSVNKVVPHEMFLYRYFHGRVTKSKDGSDVESVDDNEFDTFVDAFESGFSGEKDDIDFARAFAKGMKVKKGKNREEESDSEEEDVDEDVDFEDFEDEEMDSTIRELRELGNAEVEDECEYSSDDGDESDFDALSERKRRGKPGRSKPLEDVSSLFAAADEFAQLLDEPSDNRLGTSHAVFNKDKSDKKQLEWESKRVSSLTRGNKRRNSKSSFKRPSKKRK